MIKLVLVQDQLRMGGTERQTVHLAKYWKKHYGPVEVIVFRPGGVLETDLKEADVEISCLQSFNSGISLWAPGLARRLKASSPDRIVLMGRTANCYAGRIRRLMPGVPLIATVRTGKRLLPWHVSGLRVADCVWVNTAWWKDKLHKMGLDESKVRVVKNAVTLPTSAEPCHQQSSENPICLNVAGFRRGKRQAELIQLWADWREMDGESKVPQLWLVGDGPMREECEALRKSLGLQGLVSFLGWRQDVLPLYQQADVAVSMSQEDSLPNFIIEAQWMGLPVVAEDYAGVAEAFVSGETGWLVQAGQKDQFLSRLRQLCADPDQRSRMATAAVAWSRKEFDPEQQSKSVCDLIVQL
jgi:glycosyltransferase involved in cell wall biosynthesis